MKCIPSIKTLGHLLTLHNLGALAFDIYVEYIVQLEVIHGFSNEQNDGTQQYSPQYAIQIVYILTWAYFPLFFTGDGNFSFP